MNVEAPKRVKHSYEQHLLASPEVVFPLLCPVAEERWAPGWAPRRVISKSGVVELDCMFMTSPELPAESQNSIWITSKHDPAAFRLAMYRITPEHTITKLEISLHRTGDNTTKATLSHEVTAIGEAGEQFLKVFTHDWYAAFMKDWESAMNHYLETGQMISG